MSHSSQARGQERLVVRLASGGVTFKTAAENIAMDKVYRVGERPISTRASGCAFTYVDNGAAVPRHTYASLAEAVVKRWYESPGHRANLLHRDMRRHGAGFAIDPNGVACGDVYLMQNFDG